MFFVNHSSSRQNTMMACNDFIFVAKVQKNKG